MLLVDARRILVDVLLACSHMQKRAVVHCDLKLANLLVTRPGDIVARATPLSGPLPRDECRWGLPSSLQEISEVVNGPPLVVLSDCGLALTDVKGTVDREPQM
jgi:serine/threonine protein kinase